MCTEQIAQPPLLLRADDSLRLVELLAGCRGAPLLAKVERERALLDSTTPRPRARHREPASDSARDGGKGDSRQGQGNHNPGSRHDCCCGGPGCGRQRLHEYEVLGALGARRLFAGA